MGFVGKAVLWLVGLVVVPVVGLVLYAEFYKQWSRVTWHEAIELRVETPSGVKSGRSIISVSYAIAAKFMRGMDTAGSGFSGEATVVEVAPGQYLFALLSSGRENLVQSVFPELTRDYSQGKISYAEWTTGIRDARLKREIPYDHRPLLVRFRDINDPRTVEKVNPDNLAASFGPGFKLKSYTLELLGKDEPVTRGKVEKVLGWLNSVGGKLKPAPNKKYADELTEEEKLYSLHFKSGN